MKCYNHSTNEAAGTCTQCGKALCPECMLNVGGKITCKECAAKMAERPACAPPRKDPFLAAVLSLIGGLFTGSLLFSLGQLYNGQVKKFIILTLANIFIGAIVAALYLLGSFATIGVGFVCCLPVFLLPVILYIYEVYDAYVSAVQINNGELVRDWLD
ncbi:hypothetical protein [Methanocella sp. MCL-LM]|uniref:hypothetical protein n=1 Tax=Methanocella sp. MCL-LM TaxID=3412035 RepID=UPI003C72FBC4